MRYMDFSQKITPYSPPVMPVICLPEGSVRKSLCRLVLPQSFVAGAPMGPHHRRSGIAPSELSSVLATTRKFPPPARYFPLVADPARSAKKQEVPIFPQ